MLGSLAARFDPAGPFYQFPVPGFRASKAALNMLMVCYHEELEGDNVKVHGVCPEATDCFGPVEFMRPKGQSERMW